MIIVYSEITLSKTSYHVETSQSICFANQLTGYYVMQGSTTRYFKQNIIFYYNESYDSDLSSSRT